MARKPPGQVLRADLIDNILWNKERTDLLFICPARPVQSDLVLFHGWVEADELMPDQSLQSAFGFANISLQVGIRLCQAGAPSDSGRESSRECIELSQLSTRGDGDIPAKRGVDVCRSINCISVETTGNVTICRGAEPHQV